MPPDACYLDQPGTIDMPVTNHGVEPKTAQVEAPKVKIRARARTIKYVLRLLSQEETATVSRALDAGLHWQEACQLVGYPPGDDHYDSFLRSLWFSGWGIVRFVGDPFTGHVDDVIGGTRLTIRQVQAVGRLLRQDKTDDEVRAYVLKRWGLALPANEGLYVILNRSGFALKWGLIRLPEKERNRWK